MNEQAFQKLHEVLSAKGGQPSIDGVPMEVILRQARVTPDTVLPPLQPLFTMYGTPCFYRGELVAVCGKAKSGKTLFLSQVIACCLTDKVLALERDTHADTTDKTTPQPEKKDDSECSVTSPLRVLWIDTEQSAQSTQDILIHRILPLAQLSPPWEGLGEAFHAYNLRGMGYEVRRQLMECAVSTIHPDLVIIDGIKDLLTDINDAVQATLIMEQLMALAQHGNCCIVCVLHMNKSEADKNMRGSIGTELTNKAFEVFQCEHLDEGDVFKVKQSLSRRERVRRSLYYRLDELSHLPVESGDYQQQPRDAHGRWTSPKPQQVVTPEVKWDTLNPKYLVHHDDGSFGWNISLLFSDAFEGNTVRPYNKVMGAALRLSHIENPRLYYALYAEAQQRGIIRQMRHPDNGDTYVEYLENQIPF